MPYITFYLNAINQDKNDVTIIYWNRDEQEDVPTPKCSRVIKFERYQEDEVPKLKKISSFYAYRKFVLSEIKKGQYDFIIALHTFPAVLNFNLLCGKYKNKFIFDYRDYTFEKNIIYRRLIAKIVKNSYATFISSNAFKKYLPKCENMYTSHNILLDSLDYREFITRDLKPIRIRYWGMIRYAETNIQLIEKIKNDNRFELHFHGRKQNEYMKIFDYCTQNKIENVFFHGEYNPEDRYKFAKETDLIQNVQDFDLITENAVSNKFYDGAIFYIPQICSDTSYMGKCAQQYGIGLSCNVYKENIHEEIYEYIINLNWKEFKNNCDTFMDSVVREYNEGIEILNDIFNT